MTPARATTADRAREARAIDVAVLLVAVVVAAGVALASVTVLASGAATAPASPDPRTGSVATAPFDGEGHASGADAGDVTLSVSDAEVAAGETTTLRVRIDRLPDGLAGFELVLELDGAGVAAVEGASYPDAFEHATEPAVADDGRSVWLEAVDLRDEVTAGDEDVTLATVTVRGEAAGETDASVAALQVDDDAGDRVEPALDDGTIAVTPERTGGDAADDRGAATVAPDDAAQAASPDGPSPAAVGDFGLRLGALAVLLVCSLVAALATADRR